MKKRTMIVIFTILSLLITFNEDFPQVIQIDTTFGQNGIVTTSVNAIGNSVIASSALQNDGKIIAAGQTNYDGQINFALVRYHPNGILDNTFGTGGIVITPIGMHDEAKSVAIQLNGKIVAAGFTNDGYQNDFALVCYNPDGSPDTDFGTIGIVTTAIGSSSDIITSLSIQSDGKIIAAGNTFNGSYSDFCLARYNADGSLDTTFGTGGIVIVYGETSNEWANSVAIQPDGKIVTAGYSDVHGDKDFALLRYNANGTPDITFGLGGIVFSGSAGAEDVAKSVLIQSDGKIVVAGYSDADGTNDFALARFNSNGTPDSTFGINGTVISSVPGEDYANSAAIQYDDGEEKIITAGFTDFYETYDILLRRYDYYGNPDITFGFHGAVVLRDTSSEDKTFSLSLKSNGKIIAAGYCFDGSSSRYALVCYNIDGEQDNSFGENGRVLTSVGNAADAASSTAIQTDGKIIAAGTTYNGTDYDAALVRYNFDGEIDTTFGTKGIVTTSRPGNDYITSAAIQTIEGGEEKIIAAGYSGETGTKDFLLARYNLSGTIDSTFGTDGIAVTPIGSRDDEIQSIVIQENGKIIAAGFTNNGSNYDFAVARYTPDGELDITFGGAGFVTTPIGEKDERANSAVIEPAGMADGKIIAAGTSYNGTDFDFALVRYNSDGELDNDFGTGGIVTTLIGSKRDEANSAAIQKDGRIIAGGFTTAETGGDNLFALVRYNSSGLLDSSFGTNGIIITQIGTSSVNVIKSVSIQSNGKVVAAGYSNPYVCNDFAILRYNTDGKLDKTFGGYGFVTTSIGAASTYNHAYSSAIQDDGKIVIAGCSINLLNNFCVFTLARYKGDAVTNVEAKKLTELPSSFSLEQNYPNPFNPSTTIRFLIPEQQNIRLSVYNLLGQRVRTLIDEEMKAGRHSVVFNAAGLASGVYFYRIQTESFVSTKQFVLLK